ncbi:protocadherin gamma-A10-like [Hypanus sabinus]|uniref:protocadherin gamma-A10-like n=1 Tax=Hypanus sabinus TaxID=79690 RepID=UPI0028C46720|nr:protocadherin gamma-A10-like [Hypanus sabinus]
MEDDVNKNLFSGIYNLSHRRNSTKNMHCLHGKSVISSIFLLCVCSLVSGQIRYSIPEEQELGAFVGELGKDLGLSIKDLPSRKFRIVSSASKQYLDVNSINGILFVSARIDREQLCGQSDNCALLMEAVIENPVEQYRVEVEILDVNDNSPIFQKNEIRLKISESTIPGARFLLEGANDPDGRNNSIRTYQLTKNDHFTLDVQSLGKWKLPELVLQGNLDREKQSAYNLLLTAIDGGAPERSGTARITIDIMDVNDNVPVFEKSMYSVNLMENVLLNSLVIKLNATDLDEGTNGEVIYSFSSYNEPRITEIFTIEPETGEIRTKEMLDFEETDVYQIHVEARDRSMQSLSTHCSVRVEITDVNDNTPELTINSGAETISEDVAMGTLIALIGVTDRDSNKNGYIDCSVSPTLPFNLESSFSNSYRLVTNAKLDRETAPQHKITVTCKDRGIPPLSTIQTIVVNISDINDNTPRFTQPSYTAYVAENNEPGSYIGSVTALDLDTDRNSQLFYTILESQIESVPISSYLYINSNNGSIYSIRPFDYEQFRSFQFHVRAQDSGLPSLSSDVAVNVIVLDQNDNPPVVLSSPTEGNTSLRVPRSADPGYLITKIIAFDADSGKNGKLSYELLQSSDPGLFVVSYSSGEIRNIRQFKDSDATAQRLVVQVKDNGYPALSTTTTFTLTIVEEQSEGLVDVNEASDDLEDTQRLSFYIIISLGATSFILLIVIIFLVVAICPTGTNPASRRACATKCCSRRDLEYKNSAANMHIVPDSHFLPSILEIQGNGSLSGTHSYKIRSAKEPAEIIFTPFDPQLHGTIEMRSKYVPAENTKTRNSRSDGSLIITEILLTMQHSGKLFLLREKAVPSILLLCAWKLVSGQIRYSIPEELKHGTVVGEIAKDLGLFLEELSTRKFRIISQVPSQVLNINPQNGVLFVNKRIDRELICGKSLNCILPLELETENPVVRYRAEVEILDVNDNDPKFSDAEVRLEISELIMPGTRFILKAAQDPDIGTNSVQTYQITPNEHFVLDVQTLGKWKIPELVVKQSLDREKQSMHRLILTAIDGAIPGRSGTCQIIITVSDTNDNAPTFQKHLDSVNLMEDVPLGTLVIKVNATDLDEGSNSDIVYSLGSYNEERILEMFSINPKSGEIRLKGKLDFEETNMHEIHVEAKDMGAQSLSAYCIVRVHVEDVNDNAPEVILKLTSSTVSEGTPVGTQIALVTVTDRDSKRNGFTDCQVSRAAPFDLKRSLANSYELVVSDKLDREKAPEYALVVACKDDGTPPLSTNRTVIVYISDINDNAPKFLQPSHAIYVSENNSPGNSIGSVTAFDPDAEQNSKISYRILEGSVQGEPMSSYVSISSDNGIIYSQRSFDYEQLKSFKIPVQARDAGSPSLYGNVTVNVIILDQNDNPPVISPSFTNHSKTTMPRSAQPGFLVTRVVASDADSGQNARISYELLHATDPSLFKISHSSGEIRTIRRFKDGDATTQKLIILVKDNGHPALSATSTINISITEQTEQLKSESGDTTGDLQDSSDLAFYIIISLGAVTFLLLVIIIALIIAICPVDKHPPHTSSCYTANCCCTNELDSKVGAHKSHVNLQFLPDTKLIANVEIRGNGSLSDTYRHQVRSAPEAGKMEVIYFSPASPTTRRSLGRNVGPYASKANTGLQNNWTCTGEVGQLNTDWHSSEPHIVGKISSQCLEENLTHDEIKREFNRRHTAITSGADMDYIKTSPDLEDGIPSWAPRYASQNVETMEPDEYQSNIYMGGSPVMLSRMQDKDVKQDRQHSASSTKKKKKRTKRSEKRESKSTTEEPQNE